MSSPFLPELKTQSQFTLMQLQQFLGHLNWAHPFLCLSTHELQPLFNAFQGHLSPTDSILITKVMKHTIHQINAALRHTVVDCIHSLCPLQLVILNTPKLATGLLCSPKSDKAISVAEWLYLSNTPP